MIPSAILTRFSTAVVVGLLIRLSVPIDVHADPPPITKSDWATYNHSVQGWRYNSAEKRLTAKSAAGLTEKWRFPKKGSKDRVGAIHATPAVVNGHVYFGTATYPAFYKLNPDGTLAWVFHLSTEQSGTNLTPTAKNFIDAENGILTSALVTESHVYFGSTKGNFYALDRFTGQQAWQVNTREEGFPGHHPVNVFMASAILADGKVIVGGGAYEHAFPLDPNYPCCTGRGFVVAFQPDTGKVIWKYDVGEEPKKFDEPVALVDAKGKHLFQHGPSTSSVWSTPSYDADSGTVFFGTDVHNSPRQPTKDNPRFDSDYSAAVVAVDVETGNEKWVTQVNQGDIYNYTLASFDAETGLYKDGSVGDSPKIYEIDVDGRKQKVVGVGCKNGGFFVLQADDGRLINNTPVFNGKPEYPLHPSPDPRMIALPSLIGGIQTGCATNGKDVFTNGIDWLTLNSQNPGSPEGGRVVSLSGDLTEERWRHERPKIGSFFGKLGDPVAAGVALANDIVCFTTTVSEQLVVLEAATGRKLKELPVGTVWSGPSISRGRIFVGTGSILFLKKQSTGTLFSFGLPGEDEIAAMGSGDDSPE